MQCNTNCVTPWCTMRSSEPYPPQREQRQGLLAITRGYTPRHAPKHVVSYVDTQAQLFRKVQCGRRVSDRYRRSLPVHRSVGCRLRHAVSRGSSGRDTSVGGCSRPCSAAASGDHAPHTHHPFVSHHTHAIAQQDHAVTTVGSRSRGASEGVWHNAEPRWVVPSPTGASVHHELTASR